MGTDGLQPNSIACKEASTGVNMLFELANITKSYGSIVALDNLTMTIPTGAIGLLGPNGAGKTTLIRTLLGLININKGTGKVLDMDIQRDSLRIRQRVGFVPEDECLFPSTIGVEFVAYAGQLVGMRKGDALQRAHEVLDYVGLREQRYRPCDGYSTGMKQRLKLAAAIVHDPRLIIMDEPTNGMDPQGREELIALAQDLSRNKGVNLLYSSHLLPDVEAVCDYVIVMGSGKILAQGKLTELKATVEGVYEVRVKNEQERFSSILQGQGCQTLPLEDKVKVILPAGKDVGLFWEVAHREGFQIRHLRPLRSSLEEVFLKAVSSAV